MDFSQACPSMWRQIGGNLCKAPSNYAGACSNQMDISGMSEKDKYEFGVKCGARWPCLPQPSHVYADLCPRGWTLQFGQVCNAPKDYAGPCDTVAYMSGLSIGDKKIFEATCGVSWPDALLECDRDYTSPCPFGWLQLPKKDGIECRAPPMYADCNKIQQFSDMTPVEKQEWAQTCSQKFPCRDRSKCAPAWSMPCPADWYAFNGGQSCLAPGTYAGKCSSVLHGLLELSNSEKELLATTCGVAWPCEGESPEPLSELPGGEKPRTLLDPASYSMSNGAIESETGAIISK